MAPTYPSKIPIGTVLGEKYRVTREIGRGGMAAVYEAENIDIGKRVAVKVLAPELNSSTIVVERFLREARAAASISSPNICDVYDSGKLEDGRPFLVLELLEGESLYEYMTRVRHIGVETTLAIVTQVARGLVKAHAANVVHRDLKPENIFLAKDADGGLLVKILDFGLAKFYAPIGGDAEQARLTREGAVFGTPAYMSPEQVKGQGQVDHRADLWALACIAYECLTGRTVWSTDQGVAMTFAQIASAPLPNALQHRPDLPQAFQTWFAKGLAHSVDERFQTAKELADALASALAEPVPRVLSMTSLTDASAATTGMQGRVVSGGSAELGASFAPAGQDLLTRGAPLALAGFGEEGGMPISRPSGGNLPGSTIDPRSVPREGERRHGRATLTLLGVGAIAAGGYVAWLLLLRPTGLPVLSVSIPSADAAAPLPNSVVAIAPTVPSVVKGPKWAGLISSAQGQIAAGDLPGATKTLKEAAELPGSACARVLLDQVQVAAASKGPCRITGIGRPRPPGLANAAGRPAVAFTPRGALVVWTDNHESTSGDHAYSILLDNALRPVGDSHDVTPEAGQVSGPQLFVVGERIAIVYADGKGPESGIHVRWLDAEGKIAGPARTILNHKPGTTSPAFDRAPDGTFWAAWEEERRSESSDLFLRHLSADLEPLANEVRASDYSLKPRSHVRSPSVGIAAGFLTVVYRLERDPLHMVSGQRIALTATDLERGLEPAEKGPAKDRRIGELFLLSSEKDRADAPRVDCATEGCYVVWHTDDGTAFAAYVESTQGQVLWRKRFDKKAASPSVAIAPSGNAVTAWFGHGKVNLAAIARDGLGPPTPIGRALGDPQAPSLAPGGVPGEWYITWLDLEAGHSEPYAARALCK